MARRRATGRRSAHRLARARARTEQYLTERMAEEGHALIAAALRAKWPGARPKAIQLGRRLVLELMRETADAGHETFYLRAVGTVARAACAAVAHRPRNERDLIAILRHMLVAARRERHAA